MTIATTPEPPYDNVIFASHRTTTGSADYAKTAARMTYHCNALQH